MEALPSGWEKRVDGRTGRCYFVDHNRGLTSWDDPRRDKPLPSGWEQRTDKRTGRFYYVDHSTERTTWEDPREQAHDGDDSLPSGWELRTTTSGSTYYVDHATRTTQWERPTTATGAAAPSAAANGGRPHGLSTAPPPASTGRESMARGEAEASGPIPPRPDVVLPSNWEIKYDSKNRRWFYLDHDNKTTTWDLPCLENAQPAPRGSQGQGQAAVASIQQRMATLSTGADQSEEPPDAICCPITQEMMQEPVLLVGDGHTYERGAITEWLREHSTSPLTNQILQDLTLVPNHAVRKICRVE